MALQRETAKVIVTGETLETLETLEILETLETLETPETPETLETLLVLGGCVNELFSCGNGLWVCVIVF
ncbi:MAG: hypothetical protein ACI30R_04315 [Sodaliphilus sp.]